MVVGARPGGRVLGVAPGGDLTRGPARVGGCEAHARKHGPRLLPTLLSVVDHACHGLYVGPLPHQPAEAGQWGAAL